MRRNAGSAGASRLLALGWGAGLLAILAWLGAIFAGGLRTETSVLAMLPRDERDPTLHQLASQLQGQSARRLYFLAGHPDVERAEQLAERVEKSLQESTHVLDVRGRRDAEFGTALHELYFPYRHQILSPRVRAELEGPDPVGASMERITGVLASPLSSVAARSLEQDPLLLEFELLRHWSEQALGSLGPAGYVCGREGERTYALVTATIAADPFDSQGSDAALELAEKLRSELALEEPDAELIVSGVPRFAAHYRRSAESEVSWIGTLSTLGTLGCVWLVLRSPRFVVLAALPVLASVACGTLACVLAFDELHALSLVFGTTLTGMGVDYALHYFFVHLRAGRDWNSRAGLSSILPAITIGALTSIIGFSGLWLTPFPILQQFALFAAAGLVGAWLTVVTVLPALLEPPYAGSQCAWFGSLSDRWLLAWDKVRQRAAVRGALAAAAALACLWLARAEFQDDIRALQSAPRTLLETEARVRKMLARTDDVRFVLVEGVDEQETLDRLALAEARLAAQRAAGAIGGTLSVAPFLPSRRQQELDHALVRRAVGDRMAEWRVALDELGFEPAPIAALETSVSGPFDRVLDAQTLLGSPASEPLRALWYGNPQGGYGATILLREPVDEQRVRTALVGLPGVQWVDRVADLSGLMARLRSETSRLVTWAYGLVLLVLLVRFGPAAGLRVLYPALIAAGGTLGILSAFGVELTLFHVLGQLLVLGLAIDYGAFLAEDRVAATTTFRAVTLSAVVSILAFGAMAFSSAPPLRALGASVSIGIALALALAPSAWRDSQAT
jgi:predicted exporter